MPGDVPAEDKAFARVHIVEQVIARIEAASAEFGFLLPAPLWTARSLPQT